jgi:hypothetical protein
MEVNDRKMAGSPTPTLFCAPFVAEQKSFLFFTQRIFNTKYRYIGPIKPAKEGKI